jgi:hypothetical protein
MRWRKVMAGLGVLATLAADAAQAQLSAPYRGSDQPRYELRIMPRDDLGDTRRHDPMANPSCGAANPQGGIPTVFDGSCP